MIMIDCDCDCDDDVDDVIRTKSGSDSGVRWLVAKCFLEVSAVVVLPKFMSV
jgi:hypothetical protein